MVLKRFLKFEREKGPISEEEIISNETELEEDEEGKVEVNETEVVEDKVIINKTKEKEKSQLSNVKGQKSEAASRLLLLLDIPKMLAEKELLEFGNAVKETAVKL